MSFAYTIEDERPLVVLRFEGDVTYHDLTAGIEAALKGRNLGAPYAFLCDFTLADAWRLSTSDVRALAEFCLAWCPAADIDRCALVAPEDHVFGCLRMWEAMTESLPFPRHVFRDEGSARGWLVTREGPQEEPNDFPI